MTPRCIGVVGNERTNSKTSYSGKANIHFLFQKPSKSVVRNPLILGYLYFTVSTFGKHVFVERRPTPSLAFAMIRSPSSLDRL
jgi:hypothetical protein